MDMSGRSEAFWSFGLVGVSVLSAVLGVVGSSLSGVGMSMVCSCEALVGSVFELSVCVYVCERDGSLASSDVVVRGTG